LSPSPVPPPGVMNVTKTHSNGGYFTSQFLVQPRFMFTRISDNVIRTLDTGTLAIPPMPMTTTAAAPWVHVATIPVQPQCGSVNFVPGIQEANVTPTPGSTCTSTTQCSKTVGHAGPGHLHVTAKISTPCPCGACCNPNGGACTEFSSANPAADCAAANG